MHYGEPHKSKSKFNIREQWEETTDTIRKSFLTAPTQQQNVLPIIKI